MATLIRNATIVNEGRSYAGNVLIDGKRIAAIGPAGNNDFNSQCSSLNSIDATGCLLLPGVIDEHVHFREPGTTQKGDIGSESRAAAAGGVTTYFDMPNCRPTTTTHEAWEQKMALAAEKSRVNYAFFFGATNDNAELLHQLDTRRIPGVKLFMGASTGNMLVDDMKALRQVFMESPLPVMTHCEDMGIIQTNIERLRTPQSDDLPITCHPKIRSEKACTSSTALAIRLAQETGATLHIAHISTASELQMIAKAGDNVTAEACLAHLLFCDDDYISMGSRIKCNPAIKTRADREALRKALNDGTIMTVATDHAPHLLTDKEGGSLKAASGMPMVQFSLPAMLTLADKGVLSYERVVELMCHAPADLFHIKERGYIREGYKADLVLVRLGKQVVKKEDVLSKCGWSPLEGVSLNWHVDMTFCNGQVVYANKTVNDTVRGEAVTFDR